MLVRHKLSFSCSFVLGLKKIALLCRRKAEEERLAAEEEAKRKKEEERQRRLDAGETLSESMKTFIKMIIIPCFACKWLRGSC